MNLDELTYGQIKEIQALACKTTKQLPRSPFEVGKKYLIRTVTMTLTGELKEIFPQFLVLKEADWIADTGRFSISLENQDNFNEVEPFKNDCIVSIGSIVDATEINKLIRKMK
jgi:spore maturation protein CgeB